MDVVVGVVAMADGAETGGHTTVTATEATDMDGPTTATITMAVVATTGAEGVICHIKGIIERNMIARRYTQL